MPSKVLRMFQGGVYINVSRPKMPHHPISNLSSTQKDSPELKAGDKRCLSKSMRWHLSRFLHTCISTVDSLRTNLSSKSQQKLQESLCQPAARWRHLATILDKAVLSQGRGKAIWLYIVDSSWTFLKWKRFRSFALTSEFLTVFKGEVLRQLCN